MLVLVAGSVSAALCKNSNDYYEDCGKVGNNAPFNYRYQGDPDRSSASYYNVNNYNGGYDYNIKDTTSRPIFKGSYGSYRHEMYESGDYRPSLFFVNYGSSGLGYGGYGYPYFSSGYYGLGYGGYRDYYGSYPYYGGYGDYYRGYRSIGYYYSAYTFPFFWY